MLRNGSHSLYRERLKVSCMNGVHLGLYGLRNRVILASGGVSPPLRRLQE